ncbi:MAG: hypothetical protein P9X22_00530 [Candidatus Zapsychrus exili]|nr:hypothetical protein [Candidatus Zapsychrus exili]
MAHLTYIRKGWENENLARYILSRFSFVAQPTSIGDDIGIDFFCTLIERKNQKYILPKNSFAIQIKSNADKIDITDKIQHLESLELPFFIGVVEQKNLKLTIYSGEYIPIFFSYKGIPNKLQIELYNNAIIPNTEYFIQNGNRQFTLKFPKLIEITASFETEELDKTLELLYSLCSITQNNISSRKMGEYIFQIPRYPSNIVIFAGSGSEKVFRGNFLKRLGEVFSNLNWLHANSRFNVEEFECYKKIYEAVENFSTNEMPNFVKQPYESLKKKINKKNKGVNKGIKGSTPF